jgi:hypothetical protein
MSETPAADLRRAVVAAGHLGQLETVMAASDHRDPAVRAAALGARARLGALDTDGLADGLGDADAIVRRRAVELAAVLCKHAIEIDELLLAGLASGTPEETEQIAWCLGERWQPADAESDSPEGDRLQNTAPKPRGTVSAAIGVEQVVEQLTEIALRHGDALCRESAVAALGAIGHQSSESVIIEATGDVATVRRRAVVALAPFDGDDVQAALRRALNDRDWQVRQAAEDLLRDEPT